MAECTKISWVTRTWSPWKGCQKVSPGCDHCYAEGLSKRAGWGVWGPHAARSRTSPSYWRQPVKWNREAEAAARRESVFPSICDPFDNHKSIEQAWRRTVQRSAETSGDVSELGRLTANVQLDAEMGGMALQMLERVLCGEFEGFEPWQRAGPQASPYPGSHIGRPSGGRQQHLCLLADGLAEHPGKLLHQRCDPLRRRP